MKTKLKRALIILFSAVCCFCMLFPIASYSSVRLSAHAEFTEGDAETMYEWVRQIRNYIENNLGYDLNTQDGKIETIKSDIQTVKEQTDVDVNDDTAATGIMKIPQAISDVTAHIWDTVLGTIASNDPATSTFIWNSETDPSKRDEKSYSFNPLDSAFTDITHVFQLAAYSIVLIFFAVSIIEQSVKYEIFSMKGMLRIFGRLLVSKIIIDLSVTICGGILGAIGKICHDLLATTSSFHQPMGFMPKVTLETSKIKLIGPVVDTVVSTILASVILLIVGTVFIMSILVCLKLILRSFELTMLVCSSPMFFACASSDVTKEYFKKFIVTFIEVASQTLFMSIALIIGIKQLTGVSIGNINGFGDLTQYFMSSTPYMIIMVAMCVMMIKPPKVLTNLLKG